jgi:hypothetical protein
LTSLLESLKIIYISNKTKQNKTKQIKKKNLTHPSWVLVPRPNYTQEEQLDPIKKTMG